MSPERHHRRPSLRCDHNIRKILAHLSALLALIIAAILVTCRHPRAARITRWQPDSVVQNRLQKQMVGYELLIIDELGFGPLSKTGAELWFELISQCYERGATLVTSNSPFDEWVEIFGSERLTGAFLDRSPTA